MFLLLLIKHWVQSKELEEKQQDLASLREDLVNRSAAYQEAIGSASSVRGQQYLNGVLMSIGSARQQLLEPGLSDLVDSIRDGSFLGGSIVELDEEPTPPPIYAPTIMVNGDVPLPKFPGADSSSA